MHITDKVAVVSGGASGLGAATARRLASEGARVGILDFDAERGAAVAAEIGGHAVQTDVGDEASVAAAMAEIVDKLGAPRIAVSCAGVGLAARIVGREGKLSTDVFEKTIRVNLMGTYFVMSYAARGMMALEPEDTGERGGIVNTASVAYQDGQFGQAAYSASKAAVIGLTKSLGKELADTQITVNAIAPAAVRTAIFDQMTDEFIAYMESKIPMGRFGTVDEIAAMACWLASAEASFTTGAVFDQSGGRATY